jgi:hypothetical protein
MMANQTINLSTDGRQGSKKLYVRQNENDRDVNVIFDTDVEYARYQGVDLIPGEDAKHWVLRFTVEQLEKSGTYYEEVIEIDGDYSESFVLVIAKAVDISPAQYEYYKLRLENNVPVPGEDEIWFGTRAEYDDLINKDFELYEILDEGILLDVNGNEFNYGQGSNQDLQSVLDTGNIAYDKDLAIGLSNVPGAYVGINADEAGLLIDVQGGQGLDGYNTMISSAVFEQHSPTYGNFRLSNGGFVTGSTQASAQWRDWLNIVDPDVNKAYVDLRDAEILREADEYTDEAVANVQLPEHYKGICKESELPADSANVGDYWIISDFDVTAEGVQGEALWDGTGWNYLEFNSTYHLTPQDLINIVDNNYSDISMYLAPSGKVMLDLNSEGYESIANSVAIEEKLDDVLDEAKEYTDDTIDYPVKDIVAGSDNVTVSHNDDTDVYSIAVSQSETTVNWGDIEGDVDEQGDLVDYIADQIADIPAPDLSDYDKTADATARETVVLNDAKAYTDAHHDATKQDLLTAGDNITIDANNVISATGGDGNVGTLQQVTDNGSSTTHRITFKDFNTLSQPMLTAENGNSENDHSTRLGIGVRVSASTQTGQSGLYMNTNYGPNKDTHDYVQIDSNAIRMGSAYSGGGYPVETFNFIIGTTSQQIHTSVTGSDNVRAAWRSFIVNAPDDGTYPDPLETKYLFTWLNDDYGNFVANALTSIPAGTYEQVGQVFIEDTSESIPTIDGDILDINASGWMETNIGRLVTSPSANGLTGYVEFYPENNRQITFEEDVAVGDTIQTANGTSSTSSMGDGIHYYLRQVTN